jgi:hypothetical protein
MNWRLCRRRKQLSPCTAHRNLIEQQRQSAESINDRVAQYLAAVGLITQLKSPPRNPLPPPRSQKVDTETVLKRKPWGLNWAQRQALRKMADSSMKVRKPKNIRVRIERSCRALLSTNHVAVVNDRA